MNSKLLFPLIMLGVLLTTPAVYSQSGSIYKNQKTVTYKSNVKNPLTSDELAMITEVYGETTADNVLGNPIRLKNIKNILRNRVEILELPADKNKKSCPLLSTVPLMDYYVDGLERDVVFNPETFNPLKYLFNFNSNGSELYKVDNSNYYIYIKSQHN